MVCYIFLFFIFYSEDNFSYIGIGYTQLAELSSSIELPYLSSTAYINNLSLVSNFVADTAIDEMIKAGNEERQIAIKNGNIDENGVPMCTVIADGQWSKRSYKTKYNSFSGAVKNIFRYLYFSCTYTSIYIIYS